MFLVGLTGNIACGKSTVSKVFTDKCNTYVIDADKLARKGSSSEKMSLNFIRNNMFCFKWLSQISEVGRE